MDVEHGLLRPERGHVRRPLVADVYFDAGIGCLHHHLFSHQSPRLCQRGNGKESCEKKACREIESFNVASLVVFVFVVIQRNGNHSEEASNSRLVRCGNNVEAGGRGAQVGDHGYSGFAKFSRY